MPISKLDSLVEQGTETIKKTLKRSVGLAGVVIISLSAMLPGIFVTPTFAADIMGAGIWLAFIVAAAVVLPAAISKAELASGMPSSGGSYVYLERTYGPMIDSFIFENSCIYNKQVFKLCLNFFHLRNQFF